MSKAVKRIIGVAAAVAIPFAAPAIAASIGLSAAIGATAGSALVGAGLGAASSAVTGGNIGRGALMGGIGGGIGGYTATPTAAPVAAAPSTISPEAIAAANATADPIAALNASQGWTNVDPAYLASIGGGTAAAAAPTAAPTTFADALSKVPGQIAAKFTDPKALADMTLRAAGQLAGSALAGSGLSAQEQALLDAQTQELRTLQQTNADLFRQRLEQAQGLIGESRYFDPEYFGLQRARQVQLAGARAKRTGLRGLEGQQRAAEARRIDLATGRDVGTAYDVGFGTGVQGRLQTMQTGIGLIPTGYPSAMGDFANLQRAYAGANEQRERRQQQIGLLFGSLTGEEKAKKKGEEKAKKKGEEAV